MLMLYLTASQKQPPSSFVCVSGSEGILALHPHASFAEPAENTYGSRGVSCLAGYLVAAK